MESPHGAPQEVLEDPSEQPSCVEAPGALEPARDRDDAAHEAAVGGGVGARLETVGDGAEVACVAEPVAVGVAMIGDRIQRTVIGVPAEAISIGVLADPEARAGFRPCSQGLALESYKMYPSDVLEVARWPAR